MAALCVACGRGTTGGGGNHALPLPFPPSFSAPVPIMPSLLPRDKEDGLSLERAGCCGLFPFPRPCALALFLASDFLSVVFSVSVSASESL